MLVLDPKSLAKHYLKGSLSREQFVSLSNSSVLIERIALPNGLMSQFIKLLNCPRELRNYSIKSRVKSTIRFIKYSVFAALMLVFVAVWRIDGGDLRNMWETEFNLWEFVELAVDGMPEPLPDNLHSAIEIMLQAPAWERLHIRQINGQWQQLASHEQDIARETLWFKKFDLLVAVRKIDCQKRLKNGDLDAARYLGELRALSTVISSNIANTITNKTTNKTIDKAKG